MSKEVSLKNVIHTFIIFFFMFGFGYLPPLFELTSTGMKIIGILFGLIYGWILVDLLWPSLIGLGAISFNGILPMSQVLKDGFGSEALIAFFFFCVLSVIIEETGVSKNIALWMITRRCFIGRPWIFTAAFLLLVALLSAVTTPSGAVILCWGIFYMVAELLECEKRSPWVEFMIFGSVFSGMLGMALLPFKVLALILSGVYQQLSGEAIAYTSYLVFTVPICILSILLFVLIGKYLLKIDVSFFNKLNPEMFGNDINIALDKRQKITVFYLIFMLLLLIVPEFLSMGTLLDNCFNNLGVSGILILIFGFMALTKVDGEPLFDFRKVASKGTLWDVIFVIAVVMVIVGLLSSPATGINETLTLLLKPIFLDKPNIFFILIITLLVLITTNLCGQAVAGVLFLTIFYDVALQLGLSGVFFMLLINFSAHLAFLTPAASAIAAVMYNNTDWIKTSQIRKYGMIAVSASVLILFIIGIPIASMLNI